MICPNCNQEVPNTAKVCGHCGHRLKVGTPMPVAQSTAGKQGLPGWVWGMGGALAVLIIGFIILRLGLPENNRPVVISLPVSPVVMPILTHVPTSTPMPTDVPTTETLLPTVTPSPIPSPKVGLFPDGDSVWDNWVNRQTIQSLTDMILEDFDFNSGLLAGREYFPYTVKLTQSQSVIWNTGWCSANEAILRQNISQIAYEFYINGQPVSQSAFATKFTPNGSHYCVYTFTVLKDWPIGTYIVTTVKIFKSDIDDGVTQGIFPAGRKVIEYTVSVSP